ncbi:MAG: SDR family NAD(P)-dependent oxidoreductase [Gammaproteobacteria bacterium]|nr:SDR family NAD(P)-dependent oxidoreductase [Gammaproteobacteria bacterium]
MKNALVIGANGTIGAEIAAQLENTHSVYKLTQTDTDYSEPSLASIAKEMRSFGDFERIICCIGVLHNSTVSPEKRLSQLNHEALEEYFRINTIIPALCVSAFSRLLSKQYPSKFAVLSAMVGSISDNKLGGWYGYRSSKAALNMMIKTASIELSRTNKNLSICAIHPGTTQGNLSRPFAAGVAKDKYYSPEQSAERIINIINGLEPSRTGQFLNWDGTEISW